MYIKYKLGYWSIYIYIYIWAQPRTLSIAHGICKLKDIYIINKKRVMYTSKTIQLKLRGNWAYRQISGAGLEGVPCLVIWWVPAVQQFESPGSSNSTSSLTHSMAEKNIPLNILKRPRFKERIQVTKGCIFPFYYN
jgi:hypothetical protein